MADAPSYDLPISFDGKSYHTYDNAVFRKFVQIALVLFFSIVCCVMIIKFINFCKIIRVIKVPRKASELNR